jgi:AcrR family transcriptional regulator
MSVTMALSTGRNESPTRSRTRQAILRAAITVLSADPSSSLGQVADAALVARSTLHRYFPERADLLNALGRFAEDQIEAATERAQLDTGSGADALVRLTGEFFEEWDTIVWLYMQGGNHECEKEDGGAGQIDPGLTALIKRGQADGTIEHTFPAAWIQHLLWAVLYTAREYIKGGTAKQEALDLAVLTMRRVVAPARQTSP